MYHCFSHASRTICMPRLPLMSPCTFMHFHSHKHTEIYSHHRLCNAHSDTSHHQPDKLRCHTFSHVGAVITGTDPLPAHVRSIAHVGTRRTQSELWGSGT